MFIGGSAVVISRSRALWRWPHRGCNAVQRVAGGNRWSFGEGLTEVDAPCSDSCTEVAALCSGSCIEVDALCSGSLAASIFRRRYDRGCCAVQRVAGGNRGWLPLRYPSLDGSTTARAALYHPWPACARGAPAPVPATDPHKVEGSRSAHPVSTPSFLRRNRSDGANEDLPSCGLTTHPRRESDQRRTKATIQFDSELVHETMT